MDKLIKCYSHLACRGLISGREGCLGSERVSDYCVLVNDSQVCSLRLEVDFVQFWSHSLDKSGDTVC